MTCPYCAEEVGLWIDPETDGTFVEDCAVCCRPWNVVVHRDAEPDAERRVEVTRAQ